MWRLGITEAHSIDVILMARDAKDRLSSFNVVDID
jgi:hypothetical protein